jgi:arylsulfatase A-like enzyme
MTQKTRKNIVLISFDDCSAYHHIRSIFGQYLQIPNLDLIAGVSTHFQSAYCQATVCGSSRASFMTGRTPHELGIFDNQVNFFDRAEAPDVWSYKLKQAGYFCSSGGKVHHGYGPLPKVHHDILYSDEQKRFGDDFSLPPDVEKKKYHGIRYGWGTTDPKDDHIFYDHKSSESAISFFETYDGEAPFYREVGFFSPHGPRYTPARFKDLYRPDQLCQPKDWANELDPHSYADTEWVQTPELVKKNMGWWQYNVRNYFSGLSHGDYHLGRVWKALKASKFAENTIVVILTDHGFMLGARNRFYKSTIWEQSAGVPILIHDPDLMRARIVQDPVALLDVGPTVLDYADLSPLEATAGRSLRDQVEGDTNPDRVVPTFRHDNVSIRKGNYRAVRFANGSTQLFDLTRDIWNLHDLGTDHPDHAMMQAALVQCSAEYGFDPTQEHPNG